MSIKTWKLEFYPIRATDAIGDDLTAVEHSIKKWEGLRSDNLTRHGVFCETNNRLIADTPSHNHDVHHSFGIDSLSCALCAMTSDAYSDMYYFCERCPIVKVTGHRCDVAGGDQCSPWDIWVDVANPEPMISLLKETRNGLLAGNTNVKEKEQ